MSWQGLNPVDDDLDGFADTLPEGRSVGLTRPFRSGGLPARFSAEVGPLLRFLDREGLAYDLTTDVSLARGEGPSLGNAPGVALAGSALWLPEPLMRRLRDEVEDGLRVASFGADALRRTVRLEGDRLSDPSRRAAGERVRRGERPAAYHERADDRVRGRPGAVRGTRRLLRRLHAVRGVRRAAD